MFCPKCGTKIEEGKRYCSNCGYDTNTGNTGILENEKIDNEVLETGNINNNETSNEQPSVENIENTNEIKNNELSVENTQNNNETKNDDEIKQPINNSTININNNPNNNNKTAIIFMLSIIAFIILFLVAIYLVFFAEDNKVESYTNKEVEVKEDAKESKEETNDAAIEAKIKTNNGTITFLVPEICANSNIYDTNNNYKSYSSTNLECLSINFTYIDYENAEEGQEATAANPYMTEYNMEKMTVELNNGVKVPALKITDNLGSVFYPVSDNSHIEISISLNEFTEQEIKKYVIVKE